MVIYVYKTWQITMETNIDTRSPHAPTHSESSSINAYTEIEFCINSNNGHMEKRKTRHRSYPWQYTNFDFNVFGIWIDLSLVSISHMKLNLALRNHTLYILYVGPLLCTKHKHTNGHTYTYIFVKNFCISAYETKRVFIIITRWNVYRSCRQTYQYPITKYQ